MTDYCDYSISTYLLGCAEVEFQGRNEFDLIHIPSEKKSRWQLFKECIKRANSTGEDDVIIICFEGHRFTKNYCKEDLFKSIIKCAELGTHLLIGGCTDFRNLVPLTKDLYWIDCFFKANFYIVYKTAYRLLLDIDPKEIEELDEILSPSLPNKLILYPFVSDISMNEDAVRRLEIYQRIIKKYRIMEKNIKQTKRIE